MSVLLVALTLLFTLVSAAGGYFLQKRGAYSVALCIEFGLRFIWALALLSLISAVLIPGIKLSTDLVQTTIFFGAGYLSMWLARRLTALCSKK